jgi:hypothetical protein
MSNAIFARSLFRADLLSCLDSHVRQIQLSAEIPSLNFRDSALESDFSSIESSALEFHSEVDRLDLDRDSSISKQSKFETSSPTFQMITLLFPAISLQIFPPTFVIKSSLKLAQSYPQSPRIRSV